MATSALDVAESLFNAATSDEEYRAAASRAYFAVFTHLRDHADVGYTPSHEGADHRNLIEHMKAHPDERVRKVGHRLLPRLRALRNSADYNREIEFTRGLAEEALERASEIIFDVLP